MSLPEPADPQVRRVDVAGTTIGYTDEGAGDAFPILLMHGVPGGAFDFRYLAPALVDVDFRVVRVVLPGFGELADVTSQEDYSMAARARLIRAAADALDIERFAVGGHSLGGPPAAHLGAECPERVAFVALLASVGVSRHRGMIVAPSRAVWLRRLLRVPLVRGVFVAGMKKGYREFGFRGADDLDPEVARAQTAPIAHFDFEEMRAACTRLRVPVLHAWAEDDRQIQARISRELSGLLDRSRQLVFEEGGHNIQKSRAGEIAIALDDMRTEHVSGAQTVGASGNFPPNPIP